jgi:MFS family permease
MLALLALVIAGFADGAMNPLIITAVQERVPKEMLGRVMGTMLASILAAAPLGMIVMGVLTQSFGVIATLGLAGAVLVVVFSIVAASPALRAIGDTRTREERVA